jgi:hypothetical protein
MSRRTSRSTTEYAVPRGERRGTAAVLAVISAALAFGGLFVAHVPMLTLVGLCMGVVGCMGLVQAVALALGIVDFDYRARDSDR